MPVSAATGDGVDDSSACCSSSCRKGNRRYPDDYLTDQPERVLVAEIVREKVLQHTRDELPFSTAVVVDEFDETERERLLRLYCTIFVETESQKPIVIGRGGEMIKRIGTEARQRPRGVLRHQGLSRSARQGESGLAEQRTRCSTRSDCHSRRAAKEVAAGNGELMKRALTALVVIGLSFGARSTSLVQIPAASRNVLWYTAPAANWNGALPIGNGRLGAMVFGGIVDERLQLNEETVWAGQKLDRVNPKAAASLPQNPPITFCWKARRSRSDRRRDDHLRSSSHAALRNTR